MGKKNLNIIEYQAMLEQDFPAFSPEKLVKLGTRIAALEYDKYSAHFAFRRFDKYGAMVRQALEMLQRAVRDRGSVSGPEIDQAQQGVGKAARMLMNQLDSGDQQDAGLLSVLGAVSGTVNYLKTKDPLYMLAVFRAPHIHAQAQEGTALNTPEEQVYYALLAPEFKQQIGLLWRYKARMEL